MVTGELGIFDTHVAAMWNREYLYLGYWAEEQFVNATQKERDSIVFLENNLEVIIDGGDCYYELEINALNTIYGLFFIWRAFLNYDMPGLKTAVKVDGKINDNSVVDKGWTAEIAIPWKSMKWLAEVE
jgi:hypothetical protein